MGRMARALPSVGRIVRVGSQEYDLGRQTVGQILLEMQKTLLQQDTLSYDPVIDEELRKSVPAKKTDVKHFNCELGTLEAMLNRVSVSFAIDNVINCCVTKKAEGLLLYLFDKSVHVWDFSIKGLHGNVPSPFGLSILVETIGNHCSELPKMKKYLIFEGFPVNTRYYGQINSLKACSDSFPSAMKFSQLPYLLALFTARILNIPYLFVNTSHSGLQRSVEDAVRESAHYAGLAQGDSWRFSKHKRFKLLKDPYTSSEINLLTDSDSEVIYDQHGKPFKLTHFLEKQLNTGRHGLNKYPPYEQLGFFDTWYAWNRFITESSLDDELAGEARSYYKRDVISRTILKRPEGLKTGQPALLRNEYRPVYSSFWNNGIGYCKGFEVDVKTECERLRIM